MYFSSQNYNGCIKPSVSPTNCIKLLIFLLLAISEVKNSSDLTLSNCPSQFNLSKANETTSYQVNLIQSFYATFQTSADNSRIQNIVVSGDMSDLSAYIKQKIVPYAIYAGVVFAVFLALLYYCIFDKSFPPCERFRRNALQKPYSVTQKRCMSYWLLILACIIFATGIVSFTAIPSMKNYISYTKCSIFNFLDVAVNGSSTGNWAGFNELKYKIGNISSLLDSANTQVGTYISGDTWLVSNVVAMKNKNIQIYSNNKDAQYISPNPATTDTNTAAGLPLPKVDSVFIKTGLGPNGTFNTMVDDIDRGLRTTQVKSSQAYSIQIAADTMVQTTPVIKANSVASINALSMYLRQLEVTTSQTSTFSQQFFSSYFSIAIYIMQVVIGFVLVSSLLIIIGGFSTHFYEIFQCRYMVHCGWILYTFMYFGMLVLAFVTISLGTVGYYSCQYFNQSMNSQQSYYRINDKYAQNIFSRIDVCILGDGNVLKKFNINNQMKTVTDVFTNITKYIDYDNPLSTNYIDLNISTNKIMGWINAIQKYRLGVYIDSRPQQTTNDNPNYAISQLNLYSNTGGGVATCSKDRWVFDATNCTDPNQITYHADPTLANGQSLSTNVVKCISLNEKLTTLMGSSWSQSDIVYRYLQIRQNCSYAFDKITYYANTLINYRDSRINLFQAIKDRLNQLYTLNTNLNNIMISFRSKVNQFQQSVGTLNNIISNQLTGLLVTSDCRAIGSSAKAIYNIFCVNFMLQVVKVAICTLVMLITMLGAMCAGVIFAVRYSNVQMFKRVTGQHEEVNQISSEQKIGNMSSLDKEIKFSEHSHSSQQDENQKKGNKK